MAIDITALYCCLDDFCKVFEDWEAHRLIPSQTTRQRTGKLSRSEMLFIMVLFHLSPFKHFKVFYHYGIGQQHRACFRELSHYDRFVSLMPRLFAPLMVLLHSLSGAQTGIYFADSTKLAVCHNRRIHRHKVFDGLVQDRADCQGDNQGALRYSIRVGTCQSRPDVVENAYPARPRSSTDVASILKGCTKATTRQPKQARRAGLRCAPAQQRQRSVNLIRNCWLPLHVAGVCECLPRNCQAGASDSCSA